MKLANYKNLYSTDSDDLSDTTKFIKVDRCRENDDLFFDFYDDYFNENLVFKFRFIYLIYS